MASDETGGTPPPDVDEEIRQDRGESGDAPAAGSIAEREAVARDDDDLFEDDDGDEGG